MTLPSRITVIDTPFIVEASEGVTFIVASLRIGRYGVYSKMHNKFPDL